MTEERGRRDEPGSPDPGPPLEALAGLREEPSPAFTRAVVDSIQRRMLAAQAVELPWWGFTRLFMEYVVMILSALGLGDHEREHEEESDGREP